MLIENRSKLLKACELNKSPKLTLQTQHANFLTGNLLSVVWNTNTGLCITTTYSVETKPGNILSSKVSGGDLPMLHIHDVDPRLRKKMDMTDFANFYH